MKVVAIILGISLFATSCLAEDYGSTAGTGIGTGWSVTVHTPRQANESPAREGHEVELESQRSSVSQVEFHSVVEAVWSAPAPGNTSEVSLALWITNRGDKPLRFKLIDTLRPHLQTAAGAGVLCTFARDFTSPKGWFSPLLPRGQTLVASLQAKLEWRTDNTLRLSGPDGFGGVWWFDGLHTGNYVFSFEYRSEIERADDNSPLWRGKVQTPGVVISIQSQRTG